MSGVANGRQNSSRFRVDGALVNNTPTWADVENADYFPGLDTPFRLRIACDNTGGAPLSSCILMCSKNGGAYQQVTTASTIAKIVEGSSDSGSVTKVSTFRLTAGTGTAATSGGYAEGSSATFVNLNNGNYTEGEGAIQLLSANLAAGDTVDFRVYGAGPVALTTYNQTPRVTVPASDSAPSSPTTYFFSNTASDLTATGQTGTAVSKSLATTGAASGTWIPSLSGISTGVVDSNADASFFAPAGIPGTGGLSNSGKYSTVSIDITTGNANVRYMARLIRVDSSGAVQSWGPQAAISSSGATGIYTFQCSWSGLGTWASGDRLRVDVRAQNTASTSNGQTATLTYDANSWVAFLVVAPAAPFMFPRNRHYLRR
jgi:hypothetical protein